MNKPEFIYPGSDFDKSRVLISLLGSFWSRTFAGKDQIESYALGTAHIANQTHRNLLETVAAVSRFDVPLFHTETLVPVVIKKSEANNVKTASPRFDRTSAPFNANITFNQPANVAFFSFPLPEKLADVGQLFNRITFPTAALTKNVDFVIDSDDAALVFNTNPFDNPAFLRRAVTVNGVDDEEITLWGFCGKFDYEFVFHQFAYAVGIKLKTSQGYKDLTNAVINGLIDGGASAATLDLAFAAICGIPVSSEPTETVEVVDYDSHGLLVVTDKTVYRFSGNANAVVSVGQVISAGTQLIRGIDIKEFFVGNTYATHFAADVSLLCCPPPNNVLVDNAFEPLVTESDDVILLDPNTYTCQPARREITALALDGDYLSACFYGDLVFENRQVPLEVITDHPLGYTYLKFKLGGFPADAERFFDEIHARGVAAAEAAPQPCVDGRRRGTLAQLLDKRVNPFAEPTAENLPRTINPLQFLVENVLRNNVFVVRILVSTLGQNSLGLYNVRHLRRLLPPQTGMIVVFELSAGTDTIDPEHSVAETITTFTGMQPKRDTVPVSFVNDRGATARLVSGTCQ